MNPRTLIPILLLALESSLLAQNPIPFTKANREKVVGAILQEVARATGAKTAMSDSGSNKAGSDMDVTGKLCLKRPDGSIDNDLTPAFFAAAKKLYGDGSDFAIDKHGALRSLKLDTAVHDAKNAVPDFRSALPIEAFKLKYMATMEGKEMNPDAYFTGAGNRKQVDQRMQTKSRLRVFHPNGRVEETEIDRAAKPDEYKQAMRKYFEMNPDEVVHRKHGRENFGDALDAYRQARQPAHENDPQNIRGDPKYNTRIIHNLLEKHGYPPNWSALSAAQKNEALSRLFPSDEHAAGREKLVKVLDDSFAIYTLRDIQGGSVVGDQSEFHRFSEMFQRAAIADLAEQRLPDLLNPKVSLRDLRDHAQALAQKEGKSWNELSKQERRTLLQKAGQQAPELTEKLKFAAAGELAMVFKSLDGMGTERAALLKQRIMEKVPVSQRTYVKSQLDLASAYLTDPCNRKSNSASALRQRKEIVEKLKGAHPLDAETRALARKLREQGGGLHKRINVELADGGETQGTWAKIKAGLDLDPTSQRMANTIDKLDKTQSVLNLIKVYQDSNGNPEAMKRALYMEVASRNIPGYDSYQLYKLWSSGNPEAQEEVEKSLVFQGLTMLPGGAVAKAAKLSIDVARTGLEITIGYALSQAVQDKVNQCLTTGGEYGESILSEKEWNIPGQSVAEKRQNLYQAWKGKLGLEQAFRRLNAQRQIWDRLYPDQKADPHRQETYRRTVNTFYEKTRQTIAKRADDYMANAGMALNAEAREGLTNLLFSDFVNGLNRELGQSLLRDAERQAAEAQSSLDEIDDYLFGLFSQALDVVGDALADDEPPSEPGRFSLRFAECTNFTDSATGEENVVSGVQVVPPIRPTFEERNTTYVLEVPEGEELQNQVVNGRVKFRLRRPGQSRTRSIVAEQDFEFDLAGDDGWLKLLQKVNCAWFCFSPYYLPEGIPAGTHEDNPVASSGTARTAWTGRSFTLVWDDSDAGWLRKVTVTGSIDTRTKSVKQITATGQQRILTGPRSETTWNFAAKAQGVPLHTQGEDGRHFLFLTNGPAAKSIVTAFDWTHSGVDAYGKDYTFHYSLDGIDWNRPAGSGDYFPNKIEVDFQQLANPPKSGPNRGGR